MARATSNAFFPVPYAKAAGGARALAAEFGARCAQVVKFSSSLPGTLFFVQLLWGTATFCFRNYEFQFTIKRMKIFRGVGMNVASPVE
jgi:hypothetical protein